MTERKANPRKPVPPKGSSAAHRKKVSIMTEALAALEGVMPKDVMLKTMRELVADADKAKTPTTRRRLMVQASSIAKDAAPYVHPKLATVTHVGDPDQPLQVACTVYVPKKQAPRDA